MMREEKLADRQLKDKKILMAVITIVLLGSNVCASAASAESSDDKLQIVYLDEDTSGNEIDTDEADDTRVSNGGIDYFSIYSPVLENFANLMATYGVCDMDGDGVGELLVGYNTDSGDYINEVWTISDGSAEYAGNFLYQQNLYVAPDLNGIYAVYAHMGYQTVTQYTIENDNLVETIISEDNLDEMAADDDFEHDWEYYMYTNDTPIQLYEIDENAGLQYAEEIITNGEEPVATAPYNEDLMNESDWYDAFCTSLGWYDDINMYYNLDYDDIYDPEEDELDDDMKEDLIEDGINIDGMSDLELIDLWYFCFSDCEESINELRDDLKIFVDEDTVDNLSNQECIDLWNNIVNIVNGYEVTPINALNYLAYSSPYNVKDISELKDCTPYEILNMYVQAYNDDQRRIQASLPTFVDTSNFRDAFRNATVGDTFEIDNAYVSTVFAADGQLGCTITDSNFNIYSFYILTDEASYYMSGDRINVVGDYWGSDDNTNYPALDNATITLLN